MKKVEVIPHDPKWREAFEVESKRLVDALGENMTAIYPIGSTGIPNKNSSPSSSPIHGRGFLTP